MMHFENILGYLGQRLTCIFLIIKRCLYELEIFFAYRYDCFVFGSL